MHQLVTWHGPPTSKNPSWFSCSIWRWTFLTPWDKTNRSHLSPFAFVRPRAHTSFPLQWTAISARRIISSEFVSTAVLRFHSKLFELAVRTNFSLKTRASGKAESVKGKGRGTGKSHLFPVHQLYLSKFWPVNDLLVYVPEKKKKKKKKAVSLDSCQHLLTNQTPELKSAVV